MKKHSCKPDALPSAGFYWYMRQDKPLVVVEKRDNEDFIRHTSGAHQSWVGENEAFFGPIPAPSFTEEVSDALSDNLYVMNWPDLLPADDRKFYEADVSQEEVDDFIHKTSLIPHLALSSEIETIVGMADREGFSALDVHNALYRNSQIERYIANRSVLALKNNKPWRKNMLSSDPRPFYFDFVRHWFAGVLKVAMPGVYEVTKNYLTK